MVGVDGYRQRDRGKWPRRAREGLTPSCSSRTQQHSAAPRRPRVNGAGRICKPGVTGKFYCGGPLGVPCSCCNGYCGPTDGCSCVFCMREDIRVRHLREGFLVNKEGRTCGVSKATGRLYW